MWLWLWLWLWLRWRSKSARSRWPRKLNGSMIGCGKHRTFYRHVPVIGKGITFQVPGSPDRWGMMCEADLEEVYRRRPLLFRISKTIICAAVPIVAAIPLLTRFNAIAPTMAWSFGLTCAAVVALIFSVAELMRLGRRIDAMSRVLLGVAERGSRPICKKQSASFRRRENLHIKK